MQMTEENTPVTGFGLPHGPLPMPVQQLERSSGLMRWLRIPRLVLIRK